MRVVVNVKINFPITRRGHIANSLLNYIGNAVRTNLALGGRHTAVTSSTANAPYNIPVQELKHRE